MDADVEDARRDAMRVFNPALFGAEDGYDAYLYLVAHFVRTNIVAAGGLSAIGDNEGLGVENQGEQVLSSGGAAGVQTSFVEPPEFIRKLPLLLQLWSTTYGQKYVAMIQPKLAGNVGIVAGPIDGGPLASPSVPFTESN